MRFVTWNMGKSRRTHDAAWHFLLCCLRPDVALVQEALASATRLVESFGTIVWNKPRAGGTGVFVRRGIDFEPYVASVKGSRQARKRRW
jgi:hypothetical protein